MDLASHPPAPILRKGQAPVPWVNQDGTGAPQATEGAGFLECPYIDHPEWTLTGKLYFLLRSQGFDARLEVLVPSELHRSEYMRVDIGIIEGGKLTQVIECKRTGKKMNSWSRQARAYRALSDKFGLPIYFINDGAQFPQLLKNLT